MSARKSISKKLRFKIFHRDGFACAYCGATPPSAVLNIDHIKPVSKSGDNDEGNLITACFECNNGKSAKLLEEIPKSLEAQAAAVLEKKEQLKGFEKIMAARKRAVNRDVKKVEKAFQKQWPEQEFSASFRRQVAAFLESFTCAELVEIMEISVDRGLEGPDNTIKYFCGIYWRKYTDKFGAKDA